MKRKNSFRKLRARVDADTRDMTNAEVESAALSGVSSVFVGDAVGLRRVGDAIKLVALGGTVVVIPGHTETF